MWKSIHFLRAAAALSVVWHHIPQYLSTRISAPVSHFPWGAAGVDVFFLISGFVMYQATSKPNVNALNFLKARAVRVLPMYWIITLVLGGASLVMPWLFSSFSANPISIALSLIFAPVYDAGGVLRPVLQQGWTLQYEMLFYCVTALALTFTSKNAAIAAAAALTTLATIIAASQIEIHFSSLQYLAPIVTEFLIGALIATQCKRISKVGKHSRSAARMMAIGLVVWGCILIASHEPHFVDIDRVIYWGGGATLITLGALLVERDAALLADNTKLPFLLGSSSYSLYLVHGITFSVTYKLLHSLHVDSTIFQYMAMLIVATGTGIATHKLIEEQVGKFLMKHIAT